MSVVTTQASEHSSDLVSVVGVPARSVVVLLVILLAIFVVFAVLAVFAIITVILPGVDVDDLDKQLADELFVLLIVLVS